MLYFSKFRARACGAGFDRGRGKILVGGRHKLSLKATSTPSKS